jgi:hypothetical protein
VIDERTLKPGPWHKSPAWRGGAFLLGFAFLLIILDWVLGSFIHLGVGRFLIVLIVGGIVLSAPAGLGVGKRSASSRIAPPAPRDWVPQARVQGEAGATYVIVAPPEAPAEAPDPDVLGPRKKAKDLTPGWWALYTLLWRLPVLMGDYGLTGLWLMVQRVRGTRMERPARKLDFDDPTSLPQPDRETF